MSTKFYDKTFTGNLLESEEIVLGHFIMLGFPAVEKAALRPDDFYGAHNRHVFNCILRLKGETLDSVMLARELHGTIFPGSSGPHSHIAHLTSKFISPVDLDAHVNTLKTAGRARNLSALLDDAHDAVLSGSDTDRVMKKLNAEWEAVKACRK